MTVVFFGAASILFTVTLVQFNPFAKIIPIILSFLRIFPLWTLNFRLLQHLQCWRKERETGKDSSSISFLWKCASYSILPWSLPHPACTRYSLTSRSPGLRKAQFTFWPRDSCSWPASIAFLPIKAIWSRTTGESF